MALMRSNSMAVAPSFRKAALRSLNHFVRAWVSLRVPSSERMAPFISWISMKPPGESALSMLDGEGVEGLVVT